MYDTYSTELPRSRVRPAAPEVPLVAVRVGLLPAPRRRREHRAEHPKIHLPEPGPLLEAPRTQYNRREEDNQVREVEHDALGRVAPDVLLVAHGTLPGSRAAFRRSTRAGGRCGGVAAALRIHCAALEVRCCSSLVLIGVQRWTYVAAVRSCFEPIKCDCLVPVAATRSTCCSSFGLSC